MRAERLSGGIALAALALLLAMPTPAAPRDYAIDPLHTRIVFAIDHLGFSEALGTFSGPVGRLRFDPEDWRSAEVDVEIPVQRLDLGDEKWNARMLRRDFLDAGRHPVARFRSTEVIPQGEDRARVIGLLDLRGVQREVSLDVRLNKLGRNPLTLRRTVGFSASATLRRSDFGLRAQADTVGDVVTLTLQVEATASRRAADSESP
ncbi:MAG: YceI family protein [Lysobacteraceae bacterium]